MAKQQLHLDIISQERQLASTNVDSINIPTTDGDITILPNHITLLATLKPGILYYTLNGEEHSFVISKGFLDVGENNQVKILVDTATAAREISVEKAEAAIKAAEETMAKPSANQRELILAEASLKRAYLELKLAEKTKRATKV